MERKNAIELAIKSAIHLQLHSDTICTACQYLHRFYYYIDTIVKEDCSDATNQLRNCDTGIVVTTCLYIASKTNENHVRLSELISSVYHHVKAKQANMTVINYDNYQLLTKEEKNYWKLRDSVVEFEFYLLRVLQFNLTIDLPHKYLIFYLKSLSDWIHNNTLIEELFLLSWSLLNDYYCHHPESGKCKPNQCALACIQLAIKIISPKIRPLIENKQTNKCWYTNFDNSLKSDQIEIIIDQVLSITSTEHE
ncbi:hypothetical protein RDWZM_007497 [Blomia tropicalis]|uniref:Cyclin N-terminal domain-containing protein n=1 Tax=Blomia tropicalis TaxID=40697 RepID=A0A9Q0RJH1_BLOTA|nr:hypothetical protein RDWZM_007497 [Blomia tropicalis]